MVGLRTSNPRMPSIRWVPAVCEACPAAKKMADLVRECTVMWRRPAKFATTPPIPKAKVMIPMCSIEE